MRLPEVTRGVEKALCKAIDSGEVRIEDHGAMLNFACELAAYLLEREGRDPDEICAWSFAVGMALANTHHARVGKG